MITKVKLLDHLKIVFLIYPLVLLYWNYIGDGNDLIEILPTLKQWNQPELYPKDFFLNYIKSIPLHERTVSLLFLSSLGAKTPWIMFLIHALFTCFLIIGVYNVVKLFISHNWIVVWVLIALFFVCPYTSVGNNEIYYNMPVASLFAKTFGVWAIYFLLSNQFYWFAICLIASSYFHPIVGLQLSILWFGSKLIHHLKTKSKAKIIYKSFLLYSIVTFPFYLILLYYTQAPHAHDHFLFDILEFRIGHHFLIEYCGILDILIYIVLVAFGLWYWNPKHKVLFYFYLLQGILLILYCIGTTVFHSEFILKFQWLKSTIWIEWFSLISIGAWIENYYSKKHYFRFLPGLTVGLYSIIIIMAFFKFNANNPRITEERLLGLWAKEHTPIDALFVVPPDFTYFKTNSERSGWVDFKAIAHHPQYLFPWYDRIHRIYNIDLSDRRNHIDLQNKANNQFKKISDETLLYLNKNQMVDFIILPIDADWHTEVLEVVYSTKNYRIFRFI
ncbi:MAG: hypothetical protein IPK88_16040 [Saprospiraceae bacterium]|nr:hypothetical protein [Candidatus Defluviibacterium haderslevense]